MVADQATVPECASQTWTVPSFPHDAMRVPSGDHATPITGPRCPRNVTMAVESAGTVGAAVAVGRGAVEPVPPGEPHAGSSASTPQHNDHPAARRARLTYRNAACRTRTFILSPICIPVPVLARR